MACFSFGFKLTFILLLLLLIILLLLFCSFVFFVEFFFLKLFGKKSLKACSKPNIPVFFLGAFLSSLLIFKFSLI